MLTSGQTTVPTPEALAAALADLRRTTRLARELARQLPADHGNAEALRVEAEAHVDQNPPFASSRRPCDVLWRRLGRVEGAVEELETALATAARVRDAAQAALGTAPMPTDVPLIPGELRARDALDAARRDAAGALTALAGPTDEARAVRGVLMRAGAAMVRAALAVTEDRARRDAERLEARLEEARRVHREAAEREQAEAATTAARWQRRERERVGK